MEPLHMTEFASERYFEKIKQLKDANEHQQQQAQQQLQHQQQPSVGDAAESSSSIPPVPPLPPLPPSTFILPIRSSHVEEQQDSVIRPEPKRPGKSRLFSFRSKVAIVSKERPAPIVSSSQSDQLERRVSVATSVAESAKQIIPFDQLFLNLPNELQVQIIASLPLSDILNLRLSSKSMHALLSLNEAPIVRHHLDHHVPAYAKRLYPSPMTGLNFHYLCGIWHRLHVAAKLSYLMCEWLTKEIFLRTTEARKLEFAPQKERMRRRLIPMLFTVFHFFETYRTLHLQHLAENEGNGLLREPYTLHPIEAKIMSMYDNQTLLRVHQVFPLVISSFCRRLRPPSYVGRLERSLRGYLREQPPDDVHVAVLCLGGLRQVERFWEVKGYNTRVGAVDKWYEAITKDPVEQEVKQRRGLLGLSRRKSSWNVRDSKSGGDALAAGRGSWDAGFDHTPANLIFNTSLAAGMPMSSLSREHAKMLLGDLPVLQQIWLKTAEALILERGIVERPADIKRNTQVLMELIREDGWAEEEEWLYGSGAPESVRPNLDAIEEDPIE